MDVIGLTSPEPGSSLEGSIQTFSWDLGGIPIESSWLYIGSVPGGTQYGATYVGSVTTASFGGLPTDRSTVHVRLWYKTSGRWQRVDAEYTAASESNLPTITSPSSGAQLDGETQIFQWSFSGLVVESSWLYVGSTAGGSDYAAEFTGTASAVSITNLPTDQSELFVRLYFRVGGSWYFIDDGFEAGVVAVPDKDTLTRELQSLVGATADGDAGPRTRAALNRNWLGRVEGFDPSFAARFANGEDLVRWVQRRMNTRARLGLEVDGDYGVTTEAAVIAHLSNGGVVAAESYLTLLEAG